MGKIYTQQTSFGGLLPEELPTAGQIMYDIDLASGVLTSIDENGVIKPIGETVLVYRKTFADFIGSTAVETIQLGLLPAGAIFKTAMIRLVQDFVTSGFSTAVLKIEAKEDVLTRQRINNFTGRTELVKFDSNLAGVNSGALNDDIPATIFNTTTPGAIELTLGVESKFSGSVIEPIAESYYGNTFQTLAGATLSGKYFTFATSIQEYYVWYNTGASVDPTPGGFSGAPIGIEVAITVVDSAEKVAYLTQEAIYGVAGGTANIYQSDDKVRVAGVTFGAALFDADAGDSGFSIITTTTGGVPITNVIGNLTQGIVDIIVIVNVVPVLPII